MTYKITLIYAHLMNEIVFDVVALVDVPASFNIVHCPAEDADRAQHRMVTSDTIYLWVE